MFATELENELYTKLHHLRSVEQEKKTLFFELGKFHDSLEDEIIQKDFRISELEKKNENLTGRLQNCVLQYEHLKEEIGDSNKRIRKCNEKAVELSMAIEHLRDKCSNLERKLKDAHDELQVVNKIIDAA